MLVCFALADAIFLRYPTPNSDAKLKFALAPTPPPDASQWNIGCVGSLALGLCVGHVHFIFFVLISFASDTRRKPVFQWNMGLTVYFYTHQGPSCYTQPELGRVPSFPRKSIECGKSFKWIKVIEFWISLCDLLVSHDFNKS